MARRPAASPGGAARGGRNVAVRPLMWNGQTIRLSISVGFRIFFSTETVAEILETADRAMYRTKHARRHETAIVLHV